MENNNSFTYITYILTSPEKLWEALTNGNLTKKYFFGREVQSDWKEKSTVTYLRGDGELDVQGEVLQSIPYQLFSFTWNHADDTDRKQPLSVTFKIQQFEEAVKLTLLHQNILDTDLNNDTSTFEGLNNGWPAILSNLKSFLETGKTMSLMDI